MIIRYVNNVGDKKTLLLKGKLGEGAYGVVYKAILDGYGIIALKVSPLTMGNLDLIENDVKVRLTFGEDEDPHFILVRRVILNTSKRDIPFAQAYPDIVGFSDDIDNSEVACMYKCADSVDLFEMISVSSEIYPKNVLGTFFTQLCVGLKILHDRKIAHRDIKPENIMMDEGVLKYIDFGFACIENDCFKNPNIGTPYYASPDIVKRQDPTVFETFLKRDIYALGITFFVILTRKDFPVHPDKLKAIDNQQMLEVSYKRIVDANVSIEWKSLIFNMITPIEKNRYDINQCIEAIESLFL